MSGAIRVSIVILFISFNFNVSGQNIKTIRFNVYFKTDKYNLEKNQKRKIDSVLNVWKSDSIKDVKLQGHTDSRADSLYNIKLSEKRTKNVTQYLINSGIKAGKISTGFFGENKPISSNNSDDGKGKNRRVEIQLRYFIKKEIIAIDKEDSILVKPKDTCGSDSIVRYSTGINFLTDKCTRKTMLNCVRVTTIDNCGQIRSSGMRMLDSNGQQLLSDGMFKLDWDSSCGNFNKFKLKWLLTKEEYEKQGFNYYRYDSSKQIWNKMQNKKIKKIKVIREVFYQIILDSNDFRQWHNKDKGAILSYAKYKVNRKWRIAAVLSCGSPFTYREYFRTESMDRNNIWKLPSLEGYEFLIVNKKSGDSLLVKAKPVKNPLFKHIVIRTYFRNWKWFSSKYVPNIYRKFRITKEHIRNGVLPGDLHSQ